MAKEPIKNASGAPADTISHAIGCLATLPDANASECDCGAVKATAASVASVPAQSGYNQSEVRAAIAAFNPIDLDSAVGAFLYVAPVVPADQFPAVVKNFVDSHGFLFPVKGAAAGADRYTVEATTVFELLGSTVTYRQNQIVRAGTREFEIASNHKVPMRPIFPVIG